MSNLNEVLSALASEIDGSQALLIMDASGLTVATWGEADFEMVAAELAGMWKQTRGNEAVSTSGPVHAFEVAAAERRWVVIPLDEDYLLTVVAESGRPGEKAPDIEEIRGRVGAALQRLPDRDLTLAHPVALPLPQQEQATQDSPPKRRTPWLALATLVALFVVGAGWFLGLRAPERLGQAEILAALAKAPELAPYHLQVDIEGQTAGLSGSVPDGELRDTAFRIVSAAFPHMRFEDRITVTPNEVGPNKVAPSKVNPERVVSSQKGSQSPEPEVQRLASLFNQWEGVAISTRYAGDTVRVSGVVTAQADLERIRHGFIQIPGISSVRCEVKELAELPIGARIYFPTGSARLDASEVATKIAPVKRHLDENPTLRLKIIGHSDPTGSDETNRRLAQARAEAVKKALEAAGVTPGFLVAQSAPLPPPDVNALHPLRMSRCVRFEPSAR